MDISSNTVLRYFSINNNKGRLHQAIVAETQNTQNKVDLEKKEILIYR